MDELFHSTEGSKRKSPPLTDQSKSHPYGHQVSIHGIISLHGNSVFVLQGKMRHHAVTFKHIYRHAMKHVLSQRIYQTLVKSRSLKKNRCRNSVVGMGLPNGGLDMNQDCSLYNLIRFSDLCIILAQAHSILAAANSTSSKPISITSSSAIPAQF